MVSAVAGTQHIRHARPTLHLIPATTKTSPQRYPLSSRHSGCIMSGPRTSFPSSENPQVFPALINLKPSSSQRQEAFLDDTDGQSMASGSDGHCSAIGTQPPRPSRKQAGPHKGSAREDGESYFKDYDKPSAQPIPLFTMTRQVTQQ